VNELTFLVLVRDMTSFCVRPIVSDVHISLWFVRNATKHLLLSPQARANAVTAIFEETRECWKNNDCAFPLGYVNFLTLGCHRCVALVTARNHLAIKHTFEHQQLDHVIPFGGDESGKCRNLILICPYALCLNLCMREPAT
jgi:hypothetical protein